MTLLAFCLIAAAALIGSLIGAFLRISLAALVWSVPLAGALAMAVLFAGPRIQGNEAITPAARSVLLELSSPAMLIEMLVACLAGILAASLMLRYVRANRPRGYGALSSRPSRQRDLQLDLHDEPVSRDTFRQRTEAVTRPAPRRPADNNAEPMPVYEVEPQAPLRYGTPLDDLDDHSPAPPPALLDVVANRRAQARRRSALSGRLLLDDGMSAPCGIQNLSVSGARVRMPIQTPLPPTVCLLDLTHWLGHEAEVKWQNGETAGLRFIASYDLNTPHNERTRQLHQLCVDLAPR